MELAESSRVKRVPSQFVPLRDGLELFQPAARPERHPESDRAAERNPRRGPQREERFIQARDLRPIGLLDAPGLAMKRRNRRFEMERARRLARRGAPEKPEPLLDQLLVPSRTVLLAKRHQLALLDARHEPRRMKAHQRDQRVALR